MKICSNCKKEILNENKVFCNAKCRGEYQKLHPTHGEPKVEINCLICNKIYFYHKSARKNPIACSKKCFGIWQAGVRNGTYTIGEGHYSDTQTFRQMARKLFIDQCAICGWHEAACDVCHIVAKKDGGPDKFDNVIMLCPNHHRMFDRGVISIEQVIVARNNILK